MSSMASENFKGSRINRPGCWGSEDGMKSSPKRRRGSGPGTSLISHEHRPAHELSGEWILHRQCSVVLPRGKILAPKNFASQLGGAMDNERVPPADLVLPVKLARPNHIAVTGAMNGPASQVGDGFFRFLAFHPQLLRHGAVELRQHLDADRAGLFVKQARDQFHRFVVLVARTTFVRINENIRIHELNAHATRPASTGTCLAFPDRARSVSFRGNAAWPFAFGTPARSFR